jgi:hypothetical protein
MHPRDITRNTKAYKANLEHLFLAPRYWKKFKSSCPLNWQKVPFTARQKANVAQMRGIYAFVFEMPRVALPAHGYIMYVGITERQLDTRFGEYLRESDSIRARYRVGYMLQRFKSHLYFHFVPISDTAVDLEGLEGDLLNAICPPMNANDMSAELMAPKKAGF